MPIIDEGSGPTIWPGYLDVLNAELVTAQESYLSSPRSGKKQMRTDVNRIEREIERIHAMHAQRPRLRGPVTYL